MNSRKLSALILLVFLTFAPEHGNSQIPAPVAAPWTDEHDYRPGGQVDDYSEGAIRYGDNYLKKQRQERGESSDANAAPPDSIGFKNVPSAIETMYSRRTGEELAQYGYDLFGAPMAESEEKLGVAAANSLPPMGEVQDDFVLSAGDELEVVFTGQRAERKTHKINSRGMLLIPDFPPIPAEGRSIGGVRLSIQAAAGALHNTQAYVSLASVRQIGVLVIGHVKRPGRQNLTVFHSALDALMAAGGVQKTGSLRRIKLVRGGRGMLIDLYDLLLRGDSSLDLRLRDGDRIIAPAIGPTMAVAGEVKRPGVYELAESRERLSLADALELGGGTLAPGKNRYLRLAISPDGQEKVEEMRKNHAPQFGDGSVLLVSKGDEKRAGMVELTGATRRPGLYALKENASLKKLIDSDDVLADHVYPLIGVIERKDKETLATRLHDFPLRLVLRGDYDAPVADGDVVRLFSMAQIRRLSDAKPEKINEEIKTDAGEEILPPELLGYLKERAVFVRGAVRQPGLYPVAEGASVSSLLAAAGGPSLEADLASVEITAAAGAANAQGKEGRISPRRQRINLDSPGASDLIIGAGGAVRVNQKFKKPVEKTVLVIGEVNDPGRYDLAPGDRLSDLLARAGGLTPEAYPKGAIFSRESERRAEEARFHAQANAIRRAISAALEQEDKKIDAGKIGEARALADELDGAQGIGRITVEADPSALRDHPDQDMLLEPGDRLYIPKRSLSVRVDGEVLSPAALQFRKKKGPLDYIREAGGFSADADKDRAFVLLPDGSAQPIKTLSWKHRDDFIPPGSVIVVPRDPRPFDFIQSAKDISQILSNLAAAAIFVNDVKNGD